MRNHYDDVESKEPRTFEQVDNTFRPSWFFDEEKKEKFPSDHGNGLACRGELRDKNEQIGGRVSSRSEIYPSDSM